MLLQTQVQGKPYKSQEAEEQRFTEDLHESNQAIQNETLAVRGKRSQEVIYTSLASLCKAANYPVSNSQSLSHGCVKRWYFCKGYKEAECRTQSFGCYNNAQHGFPKCAAIYSNTMTIANRKVNIRTGCQCA